jgi:hypothetical protein
MLAEQKSVRAHPYSDIQNTPGLQSQGEMENDRKMKGIANGHYASCGRADPERLS